MKLVLKSKKENVLSLDVGCGDNPPIFVVLNDRVRMLRLTPSDKEDSITVESYDGDDWVEECVIRSHGNKGWFSD